MSDHQTGEEVGIEAMRIFESVQNAEPGVDAQNECNIPQLQVQIDESYLAVSCERQGEVARDGGYAAPALCTRKNEELARCAPLTANLVPTNGGPDHSLAG